MLRKLKNTVRNAKRSVQTDGVATSKRDKLAEILFSKEFWLFSLFYSSAVYVFLSRDGASTVYYRVFIVGMFVGLLSLPLAYWLVNKYVNVDKSLVAAFDAAEQNHDVYITDPETERYLRQETDERVTTRRDEYGNRVSVVQEVTDPQRLEIRGVGPDPLPDDDAMIAEPRDQIKAWREQILDTLQTARDYLLSRPAQQAQAEHDSANRLVAQYEESVSEYGNTQEQARREMDSYDGVDSDETLGEVASDVMGELNEQDSKTQDGDVVATDGGE